MTRAMRHVRRESYRCDDCRDVRDRCEECRARRAAARRELRAQKAASGICIDCAERAIKGQLRCKAHEAENLARSTASHDAARRAAGARRRRVA